MHPLSASVTAVIGFVIGVSASSLFTASYIDVIPGNVVGSAPEPDAVLLIATIESIGAESMRIRAASLFPDRPYDTYLLKGTFRDRSGMPLREGSRISLALSKNEGALSVQSKIAVNVP